MNKSLKNLLLLSLIVPLTGCGGNSGNSGSGGSNGNSSVPSPSNPASDAEQHLVSGTIHDLSADYDNGLSFIKDKNTEYYIATVNDSYAIEAAKFIVRHLFSATGADISLKVLDDSETVPSFEKAIVIGSDASYKAAGLTETDKDIGITGYEMHSKGNAVYIRAGGDESYELAAIKFLEYTVGYDCLYNDCIIYEKDGSVLPIMDVVERPDFDYRKTDAPGDTYKYDAGFSNNKVFMTVGGIQYHTSFQYLPPETYGDEHPGWYTDRTIATGITSASKGSDVGQLCYTAHGDEAELALMEQKVADKVIETYDNNPDLYNVTFTIEDNSYMCDCDSCKAVKEEYNGSIAATCLLFANAVDDIVQDHYEEVAEMTGTKKREAYLCFFAYHATEVAPVRTVKGGYEAVNGIHTNEHVAVFIAPISSVYTHSFYESENEDAYTKIKSWSVVSDHIYCWVYACDFQNYLYPFNSFTAMVETFRFLKENHCSLIYPQNEHGLVGKTVFTKLKYYLDSKALINVNINVSEYINKFFKYYYGEGETYMRKFYDEMVQWCLYQEEAWPVTCSGTIYMIINKAELWNENVLKKWEGLCNSALEAIAPLKNSDNDKYMQQRDAIVSESIFPRWALLELFYNSFTSEELTARRKSFKEDAISLGFDSYKESNGDMTSVYQGWGV